MVKIIAAIGGLLIMALALFEALPKGVRKNNPLNIEQGENWDGLAPTQSGRFCTFVSPVYGFRAAARIISGAYVRRGKTTIQEVISTWAPPQENPTTDYIAFVTQKTGLHPNDNAVSNLTAVLWAMAQFENGGDFYGKSIVERGVKAA